MPLISTVSRTLACELINFSSTCFFFRHFFFFYTTQMSSKTAAVPSALAFPRCWLVFQQIPRLPSRIHVARVFLRCFFMTTFSCCCCFFPLRGYFLYPPSDFATICKLISSAISYGTERITSPKGGWGVGKGHQSQAPTPPLTQVEWISPWQGRNFLRLFLDVISSG